MSKKTRKPTVDTVIDASLNLAETRSWRDISLNDIADEAGISLSQLNALVRGKTDILRKFSRRNDQALLDQLESEPPEGDPHDRLFDIIMARLELMTPWRKALANIASAPAASGADWAALASSVITSQEWVLAAAGLDRADSQRALKVNGLALVYVRTMRVWLEDDDPGLSRTMAALDRHLRDGADWLKRLETPMALAVGIAGMTRGFLRGRRKSEQPATEQP